MKEEKVPGKLLPYVTIAMNRENIAQILDMDQD